MNHIARRKKFTTASGPLSESRARVLVVADPIPGGVSFYPQILGTHRTTGSSSRKHRKTGDFARSISAGTQCPSRKIVSPKLPVVPPSAARSRR